MAEAIADARRGVRRRLLLTAGRNAPGTASVQVVRGVAIEDVMKKVILTPAVDVALRTLGPDEVRRLRAWFDHLANWDGDPFVRENSHTLAEVPGVRVFRTSSDTRIFFTIEGDTITVLDVARKQSIMTTAG